MSDAIVDAIVSLPRLRRLRLMNCEIDDCDVYKLATLRGLEELDLGGTDISDGASRSIVRMPSLRILRVDNTRIGDESLAQFVGMQRLEDINLWSTTVTDRGASVLLEEKPPTLRRIGLFGTGVSTRLEQAFRDSGCEVY